MTDIKNPVARRAFVAGFGVGAAALGAGLASCATADEKPAPATVAAPLPARWQPALESQDDWMDLPGKHRMVFDSISPDGAGRAINFANNYIVANKKGYGLVPADLATIVVFRSMATPFGFTDAIWEKYGKIAYKALKYKDPKTKKMALRNTLLTPEPSEDPDELVSIPSMVEKNVHFAICAAATHGFSHMIAKQTGGKADDVFAELAASLVPNATMVPAGIVAVNRAQERGYAFSYIG